MTAPAQRPGSVIRPSVWGGFEHYSEDLEGRCPYMYCDAAEPVPLVTTATGYLCDSPAAALGLPWKRRDGTAASRAEVVDAWFRVKYRPVDPYSKDRDSPASLARRVAFSKKGGGVYAKLTSIRLSEADLDRLVFNRLESFGGWLATQWPAFATWPSDAQLGALSLAWARGPARWADKYPKFTAACARSDWAAAAVEGQLGHAKGTVVTRNARQRVCFQNAAIVQHDGLDPSVLYWPEDLSKA